ncbi:MAG TPA: hypothetical protein DCR95_14395 [Desulfobacter sp.]|nr:hypothetical protein [Desulfobacter sp.]
MMPVSSTTLKLRCIGVYFLFFSSGVFAVLGVSIILERMPLALIVLILFLFHFVAIMLTWIHGPLSWMMFLRVYLIMPSLFWPFILL